MAYTIHSERTCPIVKQRRERIRMAIMEKRRRREESSEEAELTKTLSGIEKSLLPCQDFISFRRSSSINGKDINTKIEEESRENTKTKDLLCPKTMEITTTARPEDGEGDDSSSGSLTDLSTFTSPNILQPVANPAE